MPAAKIEFYVNRLIRKAMDFGIQNRCESDDQRSLMWLKKKTELEEATVELNKTVIAFCNLFHGIGKEEGEKNIRVVSENGYVPRDDD